jgi:hypothetical protein
MESTHLPSPNRSLHFCAVARVTTPVRPAYVPATTSTAAPGSSERSAI